MKVTGRYTLKASPQQVWDTITNPEKIKGCLPGCNRMEIISDNEYSATLSVGVGAVKGTYEAKITAVTREASSRRNPSAISARAPPQMRPATIAATRCQP